MRGADWRHAIGQPSKSLAGQFGPKGALYDGWETRRHNAPDHDWYVLVDIPLPSFRRVEADSFRPLLLPLSPRFSARLLHRVIIALGPKASSIVGFDIDTAHFTGNYGPEAAVYGLSLSAEGKDLEREEAKLDGDDPRVSCLRMVEREYMDG